MSGATIEPVQLQEIRLQHDWAEVVKEGKAGERVWTSLGGIHESLELTRSPEGGLSFSIDAGGVLRAELLKNGGSSSSASSATTRIREDKEIGGCEQLFHAPQQSICTNPRRFLAVAVTPCLQWLAASGEDGHVVCLPTERAFAKREWATIDAFEPEQDEDQEKKKSREEMREYIGHVGDVYAAKWFPSGKVLLTCGADCQLKIYDAFKSLTAAASLVGHAGAVLDADFVDRGRQLLSGSRDGTARLWDVPQQCTLSTFAPEKHRGSVTRCAVDLESAGAILYAAHSRRGLLMFDSRDSSASSLPQRTFLTPGQTVNCFANSSSQLVLGTESGGLEFWDLRNHSSPTLVVHSDFGPILHMQSISTTPPTIPSSSSISSYTSSSSSALSSSTSASSELTFWFSTSKGSLLQWQGGAIRHSLSGPDLDPVFHFTALHNNAVFSVARDKILRRYQLF